MVRVLNIIASMNQGGAENFIMNVYRNINREIFQFDFCMAKKESGFFDNEIRTLGGRIFRLDSITKIGLSKFRAQFGKILEENAYDVVHCHMSAWCWVFLPVARKKKVSIRIAHSHISHVTLKTYKGIINNLMALYVRNTHSKYANVLLACSKEAANWLYGKKEQVTIVKNGIDTEKFRYDKEERCRIRAQLGVASDEILLGHVGRFTPQKNHGFLIEVFRIYHKNNDKSKLLLIGNGILQNEIRQKVRNYGLESAVIFAGNLENVCDYMSAIDMFLFPSLYEGLGIVLIEAQCSGLKCIISDSIPSEVDITELIIRSSIQVPPIIWAERIQEAAGYVRKSHDRQLREAGYDIQSTVKVLKDSYMLDRKGEV